MDCLQCANRSAYNLVAPGTWAKNGLAFGARYVLLPTQRAFDSTLNTNPPFKRVCYLNAFFFPLTWLDATLLLACPYSSDLNGGMAVVLPQGARLLVCSVHPGQERHCDGRPFRATACRCRLQGLPRPVPPGPGAGPWQTSSRYNQTTMLELYHSLPAALML